MFNALETIIKQYNTTNEDYKAKVQSIHEKYEWTQEHKEEQVKALNPALLEARQTAHSRAMELLDEQERIFNAEVVDTDFLVKCKLLGEAMPTQALKNFLDKHKGDFYTIEALSGLYQKELDKKAVVDEYRLKQELVGLPTVYFTTAEYLADMRTALDNFFGQTKLMPSAMQYSNFTSKVDANHIYAAMNIGKEAVGEKPITLTQSDTFSKQTITEPVADTGFTFKGVR